MKWIALGLVLPLLVGAAALGGAFLTLSLTWQGRLAGAVLLLLPLAPGLALAFARRAPRFARLAPVGALAAALLAIVALALASPHDELPIGSPYRSVRFDNARIDRFSVANLVPEVDAVRVGAALLPFVDRVMTPEQGARIRDLMTPAYLDIEADPSLRALASALPSALAELRRGDWDDGHLWAYLPERAPGERPCAIVFLHGSAGHFKY